VVEADRLRLGEGHGRDLFHHGVILMRDPDLVHALGDPGFEIIVELGRGF